MSINRLALRAKRAFRVRKKVSGTPGRPRLTVFRSNKNISVQIINDIDGTTLCSVSSLDKDVVTEGMNKVDISGLVGKMIAEKAIACGIKSVVFDRNGFLYKGSRIKVLADSARENGLEF